MHAQESAMPTDTPPSSLPARLLLATDLGPRCDRALDRSAQLCTAWGAALTVLNVLDAPRTPDQVLAWAAGDDAFDPEDDARRQLTQDLAHLGMQASIRLVRSPSPAETIERVAHDLDAGLVITGVARDEPLGRFLLGSNVVRLASALQQPLLIVRNRARGMYRRVVVASDLSPDSQEALRTAARWFTGAELDVLHAQRTPASADAADGPEPRSAGDTPQRRCERFVFDSGLPEGRVARIAALDGALEVVLTRYVRQRASDLVVMGPHASLGLLDALLGSSLEKVLQWIPSDVLVVPATARRDA